MLVVQKILCCPVYWASCLGASGSLRRTCRRCSQGAHLLVGQTRARSCQYLPGDGEKLNCDHFFFFHLKKILLFLFCLDVH